MTKFSLYSQGNNELLGLFKQGRTLKDKEKRQYLKAKINK